MNAPNASSPRSSRSLDLVRRHARIVALAGAVLLVARRAPAQWPAPASVPRDQLSNPMYWPSDPEFGPHLPGNEGQYQMFSWMPAEVLAAGHIRAAERTIPAGNSIDAAWQHTIGDPRVLIAVVDSGIEWDRRDLQLKAALNAGELPLPQIDASGTVAASYDADGDGMFNVGDYLRDARVPCGTSLPHPLRGCVDAAGHSNDPNGNGVFDAGDLIRVFSDGTDADHNGYVDDISGWDFFKDDNDAYDDTRYGHGTGEASDSTAETNNAIDGAGNCPRCMFVPVRTGDCYVASDGDFAQSVLYAADLRLPDVGYGVSRVHVIQDALVSFTSEAVTRAIDYAYEHGLVLIASAADENSRHQMLPATNNHAMVVHAVRYDTDDLATASTVLAFNNCTNFGAQLMLSAEGNSCSSEATGQISGIAGLMASMALQSHVTPELSTEEVRQILIGSVDDINVPESIAGAPNYNGTYYPSLPGWDQRFGYGRVNAQHAVQWIRDGRIPPEVDITSPRWFAYFDPDHADQVRLVLEGRINARRAMNYDFTVEWAPGIEPADSAWQTLAHQTAVTAPTTGTLATLDLSTVHVDNPGEIENRFTITLRVRAVAHYGATSSVMDVPGESRRAFSVVRDPDLMPGYPLDLRASGEASPHLADMDEDGHADVVLPTASGLIHAIRSNGTEAPGFPVHTDPAWGFGHRTGEPDYTTAPAYSGAGRALDPATTYEPVSTAAGIADLDGDGHQEVVVAGYQGGIYVFRHDGTPWGHGFPVRLPAVPSAMTNPDAVLDRGVHASPVLIDLDGDTHPEIVVGAFDGWLYAFDAATGAPHAGFPVELHNTTNPTRRARVFGGVTAGHFDADTVPDLLVVTNEQLLATRNTGLMFLVHGDGSRHAGGPMHPHWPVVIDSTDVLPDLGEGLSNALPAADFDGDHIDDLAIAANGQPGISLNRTPLDHDVPQPVPLANLGQIRAIRTSGRGLRSDAMAPGPFTSTLSSGAIGDINADGVPDYAILGATLSTLAALDNTGRVVYEHQLGAWDGRTGTWITGFPRRVEDFGFLSGPVIADVTGDGYPEVALGTGGFLHHAVDGCGREAPGFPKTTGQWNMAVAAIGDIDGDGRVEYAANTRNGWLFVWHTQGVAGGAHPWPTWRHDNANTGNYGSPLATGVRQVPGLAPLTCTTTPPLDGGVVDASTDSSVNADADAGPRIATGGGCGCRTQGSSGRHGVLLVSAALAAIVARRRRARG